MWYTNIEEGQIILIHICPFLTVLASMVEHAQIKSMATPVPAAQALLAPTVNMRSTSVTPSPASMEASVKMLLSLSGVRVPKATQEIVARYKHLHPSGFYVSVDLYG